MSLTLSLTFQQLCRTRRQTAEAPALQPKLMQSSTSELLSRREIWAERAWNALYGRHTHSWKVALLWDQTPPAGVRNMLTRALMPIIFLLHIAGTCSLYISYKCMRTHAKVKAFLNEMKCLDVFIVNIYRTSQIIYKKDQFLQCTIVNKRIWYCRIRGKVTYEVVHKYTLSPRPSTVYQLESTSLAYTHGTIRFYSYLHSAVLSWKRLGII